MGFAFRKWTDDAIEREITKIANQFKPPKMPSNKETIELYGGYGLAMAITKSGGFAYWANRLGLPQGHSDTKVGVQAENDISAELIRLGYEVEPTSTKHPYDLLVNGCVSKMTEEQAKTFGAELKRLREEAGLSAEAFGELCDCSYIHIYGIESGKRKPSPELAERIADAFNLTVSDMLKPYEEHVWEVRRKIGATIRDKRREKGLTINTIAGALGVLPYVYEEYEKGLCSITDREMDILNKMLGIGEKPKVETVKEIVEIPAEVPSEICDLILGHIKDLQVSEDEQKKVWRYFNKIKLDAEERRLFG